MLAHIQVATGMRFSTAAASESGRYLRQCASSESIMMPPATAEASLGCEFLVRLDFRIDVRNPNPPKDELGKTRIQKTFVNTFVNTFVSTFVSGDFRIRLW